MIAAICRNFSRAARHERRFFRLLEATNESHYRLVAALSLLVASSERDRC